MFNNNDSVDYSNLQLYKKFSINKVIKSLSALAGNEIAILGDSSDTIRIFNYRNNSWREIEFNFHANILATSSNKDDKVVLVTSQNVQIKSHNFGADKYSGKFFKLPNAHQISLVLVNGNKIIIKSHNSVHILDCNQNGGGWICFDPQNIIKNLDANYCLAALFDNLFAIGSGKTIYLYDYKNKIVKQFSMPGTIQALTKLDNNHFTVAFIECEFHGNMSRSGSYSNLNEEKKEDFVPTFKRQFISTVRIYNINSLSHIKELHWNNSKSIKFLAAPSSGDKLIVGFEEHLIVSSYAAQAPWASQAGDLLQCQPNTTQNNTHFEIYKFDPLKKD